jgi:hypothetical protein
MLIKVYRILINVAAGVLFAASGVAQIHLTNQLDEKSLTCDEKTAYLRAYDLSPDGKRLAILTSPLALFNQPNAPSCLGIWEMASQRILKSVDVDVHQSTPGSGFSPQVLFIQQGKGLVLQNQKTISIYNTDNLAQTRQIETPKEDFQTPLQVLFASEANTLLVSFGTPRTDQKYLEAWRNLSEVVDVVTGDVRGVWKLEDIPLTVSPDGKRVVISDRSHPAGVLGISFVDVVSGSTVRLKDPQLGFTATGETFGRLIAQFLDNGQLLVTPDGNLDQKGRNAGAEIKVVFIPQGTVLQEVKPKDYGPTGELAVSGTHTSFATISRFVSPWVMTHHVRLPSSAAPNLLVIERDGASAKTKASIHLEGILALRDNRTFDQAGFRMSQDGHVVSVLHDYGVRIYSIK